MEDIHLFLLKLKQQIEIEYYKLQLEYSDYTKLNIIDIINEYEQVESSINKYKSEIVKNKSNNLYLSAKDINNLLEDYEEGTYGILNYFINPKTHNIIEYISKLDYTFYNKQSVVDKIITKSNDDFTTNAKEESYGLLFLYIKHESSSELEDLHKIYLLKNNSIEYLNEETTEDSEHIITKIYEFGSKIMLKDIIYKNSFEEDNNINLINSTNSTNSTNNELILLETKQKQLLTCYKLIKKYNKYIEDNINEDDIKQLYNNFSLINSLIRKVLEPTITKYKIEDILNFNYVKILEHFKVSNRLEQSEYTSIIEQYYDEPLSTLTENILVLYNLDNKFKPYMQTLFEILIRLYIDNNLGYKSYSLSKTLLGYLKFSNILCDPDTNTLTLKKRHWIQLLNTNDNQKIISSILYLIKTKTYTLDATFKYFELIFGAKNIKY